MVGAPIAEKDKPSPKVVALLVNMGLMQVYEHHFFCPFSLVSLSFLISSSSVEEMAIVHLFELITEQLEHLLTYPSSSIAFPTTFLALATAVPAVFSFASRFGLRLARVLKKLNHHGLAVCTLLCMKSDTSATPTESWKTNVARFLLLTKKACK